MQCGGCPDARWQVVYAGDTGTLAQIEVVNGGARGTLGHEEALRRMRRALIPKKVGLGFRVYPRM